MFIRQWIAAAIALLVLFGCQYEDEQTEQDLTESNAFEATIKTTDVNGRETTTFTRGETVNITVAITNTSSETQTLEFGSTQQYDFAIKNQEGVEIWRLSAGMSFATVITSYTLSPGESKAFTYQWDQGLSGGMTYISAGQYTLEADNLGIGITPQQNLTITENELSNEDFAVMINTSLNSGQDIGTFSPGEDVNITVSITNNSSETKILNGPIPLCCNIIIKNQEGDIVWRPNDGSISYPAVMNDYSFEPGESKVFTYLWDQMLSEGTLAPFGEYIIEANVSALNIIRQQTFSITDSKFKATIETSDKFGQYETTFSQGEPIDITITVTNISGETQMLEFVSSQTYDIAVQNQEGIEIWRWSDDKAIIAVMTSYSFKPGESLVYTYQWDQTLPDGRYPPSGEYTLKADHLGISLTPQQPLNII